MKVLDWLKHFWETKNTQQKTNIILVTTIFIASSLLIFTWASKPDYKVLYSNLSSKDASAITKKLQEEKIQYKLENDGSSILVPQRNLYETRLQLAGAGLPENGEIGFELFDKMNLQTSEFIENINYIRALQGELSKTIASIEEVESARVLLNIPKETLYMEEEKPSSASIVLSLRKAQGLSSEQAQSIAYLVSSSVKNLKPENITIVDDKGNLLYSPEFAWGGFESSSHLKLQRDFQKEIETRVQSMLEKVFGQGKSLVKVAVEMEFDRQTIEKEKFEPIEKNEGALRSLQEVSEAYAEAVNTSSYSGAARISNTSGKNPFYDQKNVVKNFELNRSVEQRIVAPGKIKRITAGIFLDSSIKLDEEGMKNINEVLESSIGIDKTRGDSIQIRALPFNNEYWKEQQTAMQEEEKKASIYNYIKFGSPAIAVILFMLFYLIMLKKVQKFKGSVLIPAKKGDRLLPSEEAKAPVARLMSPPMPEISLGQFDGVSVETTPQADESDIIKKMAQSDPARIARMVETILSESD